MAILNPFRIGQGVLGQQLGPYPYGVLNAGQVPYWQGDEFKIPSFTPQPWIYNPPAQQSPASPMEQQVSPNAGILAAMMNTGDGGAGNSVGGGAPGGTVGGIGAPNGVTAAGDETGGVGAPQGVPGGFGLGIAQAVDQTAPSAPTAPASGMPSNAETQAGKSVGNPASQAAAQAANQAQAQQEAESKGLGRANIDKAVQEKGLIDALKDAMQATAPSVGLGVTNAVGSTMSSQTAVDSKNADTSGDNSGGGEGNSNGTGGSTGSPAGNTGATDPGQDNTGGIGAGSTWRKGGPVPDDGDGRLEPVRGILHEREFVLTPEVTAAIHKKSPGLLNRLAKMQKMMAA